jgi:ribonuclease BN (tRNA processing enzyme)
MKAHVAFAGVGGAFASSKLWNNQPVLELEDDDGNIANILLDCSPDARHSLSNIGLGPDDIHAVAITHFHGDHVFGLEWLGFHRRFVSKLESLPVIIGPSASSYVTSTYRRLTEILGEMLVLEDRNVHLSDYFNFKWVSSIDLMHKLHLGYKHEPHVSTLEINGVKVGVRAMRVPHVRRVDYSQTSSDAGTSLSYMFNFGDKKILFTGDIQFCPDLLMPYYEEADWVIHDCADYETKSKVHAPLKDLLTLPESIQKKTILCHHSGACLNGDRGFFTAADVGQRFNLQVSHE